MRFTGFFLLLAIFFAPAAAATNDNIQLLDANLIAKLHLADVAKDGQMVGAYVMSFRPKTGHSVNSVTVLLNPGLEFIKADAGKARLAATSAITPVAGMDMLELNAVKINLGRTLSGTKRMDIAIHFRGYLEELSWTGLDGVKEILSPEFTMLRAQAFAYPVFADADIKSIRKAWTNQRFLQFADITIPGANEIVGALSVAEKTVVGTGTKTTLKSKRPSSPMALAIGPFQSSASGPVTVSHLGDNDAGAQTTLKAAAAQVSATESLLGAPTGGARLNIIEVPAGFGNSTTAGAIFREGSFFSAPTITPDIKKAISDLWKSNNAGNAGNWSNGLDRLIDILLANPDMLPEFQMMQFETTKQLFGANKLLGKTALTDYVIEGLAAESDEISALGFMVLRDILGQDAFFKLVRGLRTSLSNGYADMETVAEFLKDNLKNKKAKKFAKNWFSSNKAGKDMAKAKSFADLVKRYR